ncbi:MAG: hypothetical protein M3285_02125 [Actinomycetota bacterium]|nr:hypothetical protein [Actinomycetota bacterium]
MTLLPGAPRAQQAWLAELQLWAVSNGASTWIIDLEPYVICRVVGVVERVRIDPVNGWLQATITDGTDEVVARWLIRRPTPELAAAPGRGVALEGIALIDDDGKLVLSEPALQTLRFRQIA